MGYKTGFGYELHTSKAQGCLEMATVVESFALGSAAVMRAVTRIWFPLFMTVLIGLVCHRIAVRRARRRHLARGWRRAQTGVHQGSPGEAPAPSALAPHFQFRLRFLVILVAVCALVLGIARYFQSFGMGRYFRYEFSTDHDPALGLRALRSFDAATRGWGVNELRHIVKNHRFPTAPEQADALTESPLVAVSDEHAGVREDAHRVLFTLVLKSRQRSRPVPRIEPIVAGMANSLGDPMRGVRPQAARTLTTIYGTDPTTDVQPLPQDPGRLVDALGGVIKDPDPQVQEWAFHALDAFAPRLGDSHAPALMAALDSPAASVRSGAVRAIFKSPRVAREASPHANESV